MKRRGFQECIRWKVGSQDRVSFSMNDWLERVVLMHQFPSIFALVCHEDVSIKKFILGFDGYEVWLVEVVRNLNDWKVHGYLRLLKFLPKVTILY